MAGLSGDFSRLSSLRKLLRGTPVVVAQKVAAKVSPALTNLARGSFQAGLTAYDTARPLGTEGNALTLHQSGRTFASLGFVSIGTRTRCRLGTPWAKYLIRYGLLPHSKAALPVKWSRAIRDAANSTITAEFKQ